jgi:hypothetical protein
LKRFTQTTNRDHDDPVAANLLHREFTAAAPNHLRHRRNLRTLSI